VTVCWLVPMDGGPGGTRICVPAPTGGRVRLTADGSLDSAEVEPVGQETAEEVRAWARSLMASGAVRGVPTEGPLYGPPPRPTHELRSEEGCEQVLRRIGYDA
jgi:hypothetical protein